MDTSNVRINIAGSVLVILATVLALVFIKNVLIKKVAYKDLHNHNTTHKSTILGLVFNVLQFVVVIAGIFGFLSINGINVTGVLAGLGIFATIVGLSLQDTFKDLFAGINIYDNNFYKVGDYVKYNNELCEVKFFNARVTKFSSFYTGNTYTVSNNLITSIEKIKDHALIIFNFDYDTDRDLINDSLENVTKIIKDDSMCKSAEYLGLIEINDSGVLYALMINTKPKDRLIFQANLFSVAYDEFKAHKIAPQFDSDRDVVMSDKVQGLRRTKKFKESQEKETKKKKSK